jgi:hypothetical protein
MVEVFQHYKIKNPAVDKPEELDEIVARNRIPELEQKSSSNESADGLLCQAIFVGAYIASVIAEGTANTHNKYPVHKDVTDSFFWPLKCLFSYIGSTKLGKEIKKLADIAYSVYDSARPGPK